jgi:nitroreductase
MDAYRAIVDKRDQRAFLPRPIPEDVVRRILQAGRMAGSAKNIEPNRFVVLRERARLEAIGGLAAYGRWLAAAGAVIAIVQTQRHDYDAGRAAQNMMLAAWNDGIGSCPNGVADPDRIRDVLAHAADEHVMTVLSFGYPARPRNPERRSADDWIARANRLPLEQVVEERQ